MKFPFLIKISPGNFPMKGILLKKRRTIPATTKIIPPIISSFPIPVLTSFIIEVQKIRERFIEIFLGLCDGLRYFTLDLDRQNIIAVQSEQKMP